MILKLRKGVDAFFCGTCPRDRSRSQGLRKNFETVGALAKAMAWGSDLVLRWQQGCMCTCIISWDLVQHSFGFSRCGAGTEGLCPQAWALEELSLQPHWNLESLPCCIPGRWRVCLSPGWGSEEWVKDLYVLPSSPEFLTGLKRNKPTKTHCCIDSWMTSLVFKRKGHAETKPKDNPNLFCIHSFIFL